MLMKLILLYGLITKITIIEGFIFNIGSSNLNCNSRSSSKYLTFESPKNNIPSECVYTIRAHSRFVCQLRIQFDIDLMQPEIPSTSNGIPYPTCISEFMEIDKFKLCGNDRNQHIYIPFDRTNNKNDIKLTMKTISSSTKPYWKIQVTQLECSPGTIQSRNLIGSLIENSRTLFIKDRSLIAPDGCTQYFTENSGTISSFNYKIGGGGIYTGKLTYAICFKRTTNRKVLHLTSNHFQLGNEPLTQPDSMQIDDYCVPHIQTQGRSEDYLLIPESKISELNIRGTYYCGNVLAGKSLISNTEGPLYIIFHSDVIYRNDIPESGFSFQYSID